MKRSFIAVLLLALGFLGTARADTILSGQAFVRSPAAAECGRGKNLEAYDESLSLCQDTVCRQLAYEAWEESTKRCIDEVESALESNGKGFELDWWSCPGGAAAACRRTADFTYSLCLTGPDIVFRHCLNSCLLHVFIDQEECNNQCISQYFADIQICDAQWDAAFASCIGSQCQSI